MLILIMWAHLTPNKIINIPNNTYDALQPEIYHCSSYSALYAMYVDAYLHTSDQYVLITYTLSKFGNG